MFSAASVCLSVCQHDNFRTIKHRMKKLAVSCTVQKSRPSSNFLGHEDIGVETDLADFRSSSKLIIFCLAFNIY